MRKPNWKSNDKAAAGRGATAQQFFATVGGDKLEIEVAPWGEGTLKINGKEVARVTDAKNRQQAFRELEQAAERHLTASGANKDPSMIPPARARLLIREMLDRPAEMAALFQAQLQPWTSLLTDYIRRGQHEGRIRLAVDPEAFVLQLLNAVIATTAADGTRHVLAQPPDDDRQLAELYRMARTSLFNDRPV